MFLTSAWSGEQPQTPTGRGSLSLRAVIPLIFFMIHLILVPPGEKWQLPACAPGASICGCHLLLWWCPMVDSVLGSWLMPPAAVQRQPWSGDMCLGQYCPLMMHSWFMVTFDWIHRKQPLPKHDTAWRKSPRARMSPLAKAEDSSWDREGCTFWGRWTTSSKSCFCSWNTFLSSFCVCYWRDCLPYVVLEYKLNLVPFNCTFSPTEAWTLKSLISPWINTTCCLLCHSSSLSLGVR